jgi:hypothetical protein
VQSWAEMDGSGDATRLVAGRGDSFSFNACLMCIPGSSNSEVFWIRGLIWEYRSCSLLPRVLEMQALLAIVMTYPTLTL